jgi:hypothetical protein
MSSQQPSFIVTLGLGLALAAAVPCAVLAQPPDPPRPVEVGTRGPIDHPSIGDPQSPQPIQLGRQLPEVARERAREAGVSFEIGPHGVEIRTEEEEMWIVRAAPGSEIPALIRLPVGERLTLPPGIDYTVVEPLFYVASDCHPAACPTPPPIPETFLQRSEPVSPGRPDLCEPCPPIACQDRTHPCYQRCCPD